MINVLLKTGETAFVVEIFEQNKLFLADIDRKDADIETTEVSIEEIEKLLDLWWMEESYGHHTTTKKLAKQIY